jgi:hypothetical protein
MISFPAVQILKTLSEKEMLMFEEFLNTPVFNKNKKVVQLFELLKYQYPGFSDRTFTGEVIFRKLMGKAIFKGSYIRNLFSDLNILLERFLQYNLITKNSLFERLLIEELRNRDLYSIAEKKIKSFERDINKIKAKDHEYFLNRNFIYEMKSFLIVDKTLTDSFRNEQILSIVKLFLITLMESSLYLLVEEQRVNIKHDFGFLKNSLSYMKDNLEDFSDSPLLLVYYNLWQCFMNDRDDKYFIRAKALFKKHFSKLSKIDKKNIYSGMQVYYIEIIDKGNNSLNKEFLNFLLEMVRFNVLSHREKDYINLNLYRNILILCVMQKETNILNKFISDFNSHVSEESRSSITAYSCAHLDFLKGNFNRTLENCNKVNFNDLLTSTNDNLFFKNDIKTLTLKCLFELGHFESALSNIDAFKHYLGHSRLIKVVTKKKYMNFLNMVSELIRLKMKFDEYNLRNLEKHLLSDSEFIQKQWLTEKLKEFKPS